MWLLKSQLNQNSIMVYHVFNSNFKSHINFKGTKIDILGDTRGHEVICSITLLPSSFHTVSLSFLISFFSFPIFFLSFLDHTHTHTHTHRNEEAERPREREVRDWFFRWIVRGGDFQRNQRGFPVVSLASS
jgi:hypothetical protein